MYIFLQQGCFPPISLLKLAPPSRLQGVGCWCLCGELRVSYNNKPLEVKKEKWMRARSGGIHSDSQENFAKLAEISINTTGIFYDETSNRRAMANLDKKKHSRTHLQRLTTDPKPPLPSHIKNPFSAFDFNIEFEGIRQEREELQRMQRTTRRQINVGILSSDPQGTVHHLCAALGLAEVKEGVRGVDLVVGVGKEVTYKYWVFGTGAGVEEDPLLGLYLARCRVVLDVTEADHLVSVVRCSLQGWDNLSDSILTPLNY